jgi:hypothetical protein
MLSHDVDQIHDREPYRILADLNHLRKTLAGREPGHPTQTLHRLARSCLRPQDPRLQFDRLRAPELRHAWPSTFFLLDGYRGRRHGTRYSLNDPALREVGRRLLAEGCEIGVHGAYYDLNSPEGYRRSADRIGTAFGIRPAGIRNHMLRWSFPATWTAQAAAGFAYDATYGFCDRDGYRGGYPFPFYAPVETDQGRRPLVVLPLYMMDTALFRYLRLQGSEAEDYAVASVMRACESGGLVSLLWHNNYFAEPEYADWEQVYGVLLDRLASRDPWCATGKAIARWWDRRASLSVRAEATAEAGWEITVESPAPIDEVVLKIEGSGPGASVRFAEGQGDWEAAAGIVSVRLGSLVPARRVRFRYGPGRMP